ncbi:uncharacterized protein J7T54_006363 [Emericellopsis cladophorae]|uniref:Uncharacterized protein n=1 Tax=Emericellopsis cladophorae TaxID=2686198 RepID=A0A9P9Y9G5_9HYPO|nr:uncharacterized protein J7T54_006363 [Emericellopsis cladophorae]KAI6786024.1 hypothetical protein J7T54_006363 [Emericellopsis cladophorae]
MADKVDWVQKSAKGKQQPSSSHRLLLPRHSPEATVPEAKDHNVNAERHDRRLIRNSRKRKRGQEKDDETAKKRVPSSSSVHEREESGKLSHASFQGKSANEPSAAIVNNDRSTSRSVTDVCKSAMKLSITCSEDKMNSQPPTSNESSQGDDASEEGYASMEYDTSHEGDGSHQGAGSKGGDASSDKDMDEPPAQDSDGTGDSRVGISASESTVVHGLLQALNPERFRSGQTSPTSTGLGRLEMIRAQNLRARWSPYPGGSSREQLIDPPRSTPGSHAQPLALGPQENPGRPPQRLPRKIGSAQQQPQAAPPPQTAASSEYPAQQQQQTPQLPVCSVTRAQPARGPPRPPTPIPHWSRIPSPPPAPLFDGTPGVDYGHGARRLQQAVPLTGPRAIVPPHPIYGVPGVNGVNGVNEANGNHNNQHRPSTSPRSNRSVTDVSTDVSADPSEDRRSVNTGRRLFEYEEDLREVVAGVYEQQRTDPGRDMDIYLRNQMPQVLYPPATVALIGHDLTHNEDALRLLTPVRQSERLVRLAAIVYHAARELGLDPLDNMAREWVMALRDALYPLEQADGRPR